MVLILCLTSGVLTSVQAADRSAVPAEGSILPFPPTPSASKAGPTLQTSTHQRRVEKSRLPKDAPNILIILLDNTSFGPPSTFSGPINTPDLFETGRRGYQLQRLSHHRMLLPEKTNR
jgi:hypothetical protein